MLPNAYCDKTVKLLKIHQKPHVQVDKQVSRRNNLSVYKTHGKLHSGQNKGKCSRTEYRHIIFSSRTGFLFLLEVRHQLGL